METPGLPERYHLTRFGKAIDLVRGVTWALFAQMKTPTPSDHHFDHPAQIDRNYDSEGTPVDVQQRAAEWGAKLDMQDATPDTAAEATIRDCGDIREA